MLTYLKRKSTDVPFIQEIHLPDSEHVKLRRDWVGHAFHSSCNTKARGVAILINKIFYFKLISTEKDSNGRFILVEGELNSNRVTLVNKGQVRGQGHSDLEHIFGHYSRIYAMISRMNRCTEFHNIST